MTIAAFSKPSLSVGAGLVLGSALLLTSLAAPAFQAQSSIGHSATAPLVTAARKSLGVMPAQRRNR